MKLLFSLILAVAILFAPLYTTLAQQLNGYDIMKRVDERIIPHDIVADMTMNIINDKEQARERKVHSFRMGDDKSIMWFQAPADIKGSSFLRLSYDDRDDDMWIYLPAFGKVRRIATHARNGNFMGSDFTYEDMGDRKLDDYTHTLLGEEKLGERDCWTVESIPREGLATDYGKRVMWIWKEKYEPLKGELYDKSLKLRKKLSFTLTPIKNYWVAGKIVMENLKTGGRTELMFDNIQVDTGLKESLFQENELKKIH